MVGFVPVQGIGDARGQFWVKLPYSRRGVVEELLDGNDIELCLGVVTLFCKHRSGNVRSCNVGNRKVGQDRELHVVRSREREV